MTNRRFAFDPPRWNIPDQMPIRTGMLLVGSLIWLWLFLSLGGRLWNSELLLRDPINLALAMLCVLLGVVVVLGWVTV